jgi:hypothetical protein
MMNFYEMKLHDTFIAEGELNQNLFTTVLRVPGGWIYRSYDKGTQIMGAVFVPFDNEFQTGSDFGLCPIFLEPAEKK